MLIVDDNPDLLQALAQVFEAEGFAVKAISRGMQAYDWAVKYRPDIIVLDMLLSGVNGLTICNSLKRSDDTRHIPIVMISAHPTARSLATAAGADAYLPKPFNVNQLLKTVKKLATRR